MKKIALLISLLSAAVSCSPLAYTLQVEKQVPSASNVDFGASLPGVLTMAPEGDPDSVLLASLAVGMAEELEAALGFDSGVVPVFSMYAGLDLDDMEVRRSVHDMTGVDFLIVADSLWTGDFSVKHTEEMAYVQSQFLKQTVVSLPYSMNVRVYCADSASAVADLSESDVFEWSLLADADIQDIRAIEKVNGDLDDYFKSIGRTIASELSPKWETVGVTLYVFDDSKWTDACRLAYLFEWDKAMDIWLEEAASPNTSKAACAAHNISVACDMMGMSRMAAEWSDRADKLSQRR
ncbi:MAG TPA: hypothetical protein IAC04_02435 [Candidatus Coprenecus stercoravium]|uniref:Lipoprotein n=1 Tax=Candidatus Coprenecus stercoravium TaxID=2840735 RepID=A0A9D2GQY3_9BACT|nr:hypothetical protein [Candidatus Coprenecus stercoravium]